MVCRGTCTWDRGGGGGVVSPYDHIIFYYIIIHIRVTIEHKRNEKMVIKKNGKKKKGKKKNGKKKGKKKGKILFKKITVKNKRKIVM